MDFQQTAENIPFHYLAMSDNDQFFVVHWIYVADGTLLVP